MPKIVAQPAKPEDRLWLEVLLADRDLASLTDAEARTELARRDFPQDLVEAYLAARLAGPSRASNG